MDAVSTVLGMRCLGAIGAAISVVGLPAQALPPPTDLPEEVLRTEIITEARSPVDGQPLSPADYAALQEALADPNDPRTLPSDVRQLIFLLQLRRALLPLLPGG